MAHWLLKSEPSAYSWAQLVADGRTNWDGVRNAQALNNLRAMKPGERVFVYHSNEGKDIVGVAEVVKGFYSDPADKSGKLGMVDIAPVSAGGEAGNSRCDEGQSRTSRNGAITPVSAVGLSGHRPGMGCRLPNGRHPRLSRCAAASPAG